MSVTITITDPSSTPPEELQAVLNYLSVFLVRRRTDRRGTDTPIKEPGEDIYYAVAEGRVEEVGAALGADQPSASEPGPFTKAFQEIFAGVGIPPAVANAAAAEQIASVVFGTPPPPPPSEPKAIAVSVDPLRSAVAQAAREALAVVVDLDKDGIPWDGRIHASTKTKTAEGIWKKKRSVEQAIVDMVTAELRMTMAAPAPAVPLPPVAVPPAPIVPPPPAPAAAATGPSFAEFMGHVTAGVTSQRFTREKVIAACAKCGVVNLPGLINRPDLIPAVAKELGLLT